MPHRDFDAARAERARAADPETFTIGGETFTCVLLPAIGDVLDLIDAPERDQNPVGAVRAAIAYIDTLLVPEDRARFQETIRGAEHDAGPVNGDDVLDVMWYLSERFTGRPTRPSDDSSSGRESGGETSSEDGSDSAAATSPTPPSVTG